MNHWSNSPGVRGGFGCGVNSQQTNESPSFAARRKGTPQESSAAYSQDCKYLMSMSEDLEKLRRSSHHMRNSSHHLRNATTARRPRHQESHEDAMGDAEHDEIVKGLLYPGLEEEGDDVDNMDDSDEFGCDDFFEEDLAMAQAAVSNSRGSGGSSRTSPSSIADLLNNTSPPMMSSYERSYFATMGRPYSDLTNEKLGR